MPQTSTFKTKLEQAAEKFLAGRDSLGAIRTKVEQHLSLVGKGRVFKNYTSHGIDHPERMLAVIEKLLIPTPVKFPPFFGQWLSKDWPG